MNFDKIKEYAIRRETSIGELAEKIHLSKPGLYLAIKNRTLQAKHITEIIRILNIPVVELFDLDEQSEIKKLQDRIEEQSQFIEYLKHSNDELEQQLKTETELRDNVIKGQKELIDHFKNLKIYQDFFNKAGVNTGPDNAPGP